MADNTKIEWTESSWNPIRAREKFTGTVGWHCEIITPGCQNCYAQGINRRLGTGASYLHSRKQDVEVFLDEEMLTQPLRWRRPRRIFVASTGRAASPRSGRPPSASGSTLIHTEFKECRSPRGPLVARPRH